MLSVQRAASASLQGEAVTDASAKLLYFLSRMRAWSMGPSGAAEEEVTLASFLLAAAHWMRPRARSFSWLAALAAASRSALLAFLLLLLGRPG